MSSAVTTTDRSEIRAWVEKNKGRPARVIGTGRGGDPEVLRINFGAQDKDLEEIGWLEWFAAFEANDLAFLHADDGRFNELVQRSH